uniref:type II toxin-antitoxin system HicA family toxin n=1 Tax=Algoriphagus sp. TaxID=1872435 RepID=UPI0025899658|nr:type II toxin-antitoxin system HicA family toxin [Algoriphagus sp.]
MSKKEKLLARFLEMPKDFHFDELISLLGYFGYEEVRKGKTAGSRVRFENKEGIPIMLHKPHPSGILKHYQLKQIKELLNL